jgi:hypothetical protein
MQDSSEKNQLVVMLFSGSSLSDQAPEIVAAHDMIEQCRPRDFEYQLCCFADDARIRRANSCYLGIKEF